MVAAAAVLMTAFLQVPRALRAHFGDVAAPPHSYYRPGVPLEAFSYTKQTLAAEPATDNSDETAKQAERKETKPRLIHSGKIALAELNRADAFNAPSNQSASVLHMPHTPGSNK